MKRITIFVAILIICVASMAQEPTYNLYLLKVKQTFEWKGSCMPTFGNSEVYLDDTKTSEWSKPTNMVIPFVKQDNEVFMIEDTNVAFPKNRTVGD